MKGLQDVVNQAKALVQRLREKETAVEVTLKDVNTLSEQLSSMRQFREDAVVAVAVGKPQQSNSVPPKQAVAPIPVENNSDGENQQGQQNNRKEKPGKQEQLLLAHQPIVLALLSENRRLAALEAENAELVKCLEEYQSALDMIMHKYRSHVTKFASANHILTSTIAEMGQRSQAERTDTELQLLNRINDMAGVMWHACEMDDNYYTDVVCLVTRLHNENKCLRELLDSRITGGGASSTKLSSTSGTISLPVPPLPSSNTAKVSSQPTVSQLLLNGTLPSSFTSAPSLPAYQSVIYQNNNRNSSGNAEPSTSSTPPPASNTESSNIANGLSLQTGASINVNRVSMPPPSSYLSGSSGGGQQQGCDFKLPRRPLSAGAALTHSPPLKKVEPTEQSQPSIPPAEDLAVEGPDVDDTGSTISSASSTISMATLCQEEEDINDIDEPEGHNDENQAQCEVETESTKNEIEELVNEMMNLDTTATASASETTMVAND